MRICYIAEFVGRNIIQKLYDSFFITHKNTSESCLSSDVHLFTPLYVVEFRTSSDYFFFFALCFENFWRCRSRSQNQFQSRGNQTG